MHSKSDHWIWTSGPVQALSLDKSIWCSLIHRLPDHGALNLLLDDKIIHQVEFRDDFRTIRGLAQLVWPSLPRSPNVRSHSTIFIFLFISLCFLDFFLLFLLLQFISRLTSVPQILLLKSLLDTPATIPVSTSHPVSWPFLSYHPLDHFWWCSWTLARSSPTLSVVVSTRFILPYVLTPLFPHAVLSINCLPFHLA
jgi:hypothetical protein